MSVHFVVRLRLFYMHADPPPHTHTHLTHKNIHTGNNKKKSMQLFLKNLIKTSRKLWNQPECNTQWCTHTHAFIKCTRQSTTTSWRRKRSVKGAAGEGPDSEYIKDLKKTKQKNKQIKKQSQKRKTKTLYVVLHILTEYAWWRWHEVTFFLLLLWILPDKKKPFFTV